LLQSSAQSFGPYMLRRRLALGGMAEIFLASMRREQGFEKTIVLKRILPQFGSDAAFVQMFVDEAVVAGRLSHPNIVQTYDFGHVEGVYYIAMEYVDGADLRRVLRASDERGRLPNAPEVAAIGEAVARGLGYAHAFADERLGPLGIVHRDISPHNILISRAGDVKVTDFGIAKAAARATHTSVGTIKGKVAYMAPEQAAGQAVDARCDEFALGIVLWECLTGRRLFEGGSDLELLRRVIAAEVPPIRQVRRDVPAPLAQVIDRALAREPADRYPNMQAMERELAAFRYSLGVKGAVELGALLGESTGRRRVVTARQTVALEASRATLHEHTIRTGGARARATTSHTTSRAAVDGTTRAPAMTAPPVLRLVGTTVGAALVAAAAVAVALPRAAVESEGPASGIDIVSVPPDVRLFVDGRDVGLTSPVRLPTAGLSPSATLSLARTGYETWQLDLATAARVAPLHVALVPRAFATTAVPPPPALAPTATVPAPATASPPAPFLPKATHLPAPPGVTTVKAKGLLSLRSLGVWVDVFVGKRRLGTTPLGRVELPAGRQRLHVINQEAGVDEFLELDIPAGAELRQTISPGAPL